jgi:ribonuclease P protein component
LARLRLRRGLDFRAVRAARTGRRGKSLAVHWRPNELGHPRIGFTVSGKVGGAVVRNRVRRRLREIARPLLVSSDVAVDIVVVARPEAAATAFAELEAEFRTLAGQVLGL